MEVLTRPVQPGEPAPGFELPAINRGGTVSLDDFRGRRAVLIGLFRGLHCPFCRRQIVTLGAAQPALQAAGVETLAVVNTPPERARLYFRHRPTPVTLLADPDCRTHQAFGVPRIQFIDPASGTAPRWPSQVPPQAFEAARVDPTGEIGEPMQPMAANEALNRKDGFQLTAADEEILAAHGTQLAGHFLIDRSGIVRWTHIEAPDSPSAIGSFPSPADLVAAAPAAA
jgi:peroxiredoxin